MQTATDIAHQIRTSLNGNTPFRTIWEICIEFIRGNQEPGLAVGGVNQNGSNIAARIWQPDNIIVNKILPLRNGVASRLATAYPAMTVLPASDTVDDEMKMKASQLALRYFWNAAQVKRKLKKGTQWLTDCGNYGLHEYYDDVSGDVQLEVVSPFDLIYEPYVSDSKDAEWVAIRRFTTKEALARQFPNESNEIDEHAQASQEPDQWRQLGPNAHPRDRIELWEVYTVDGRHMILLGQWILWEGRTTTKKPPVQHVKYNEISGYLQGVGMVEMCLSTQIMRNRFLTQIMKNAYMIGNPKILRPSESGVEPGAFAADAGEIVDYIGGHAPQFMQAPPLPQYLVELPSRLDADMGDAASQHAISQGKLGSAKSGVAIDALTANDLSPLQLVQENIEEAVSDMAACVLQLMKAHYSEGKMMRMMDTTGQFVFQELRATDLVEDPEIFLEAGSLFRSEAQDRDQKTLEFLKAGLISPDAAKMNLSTHAVTNDMVEQMQALRRAKDLLGAVVQFNRPLEGLTPVDDLDALKKVFADFIHSPEFYRLPLAKQDMVDSSYQQVVQMILQKQQQMAGPPMPPPGPGKKGAGGMAASLPVAQASQLTPQSIEQGAQQFEQPNLGAGNPQI